MRKRKTKREVFLETMDEITPWDEIVAMIEPYYYKNHLGRRPRDIEVLFRMYLLATWFNLSDEAVEDAIYGSYAMRKFMGMDFTQESMPDATTLCKLRKLINDNGLGERYFAACKEVLEQHGRIMHGGIIVDARIIDASSSTKNAKGKRAPEMHQTRNGNQWYFGAKLHVGVDVGSGYIHTTLVTPANVHYGAVAHKLQREDDNVAYGDSAYCSSTSTRMCRITRICRRWISEPTSRSPTASTPGTRAPALIGSGSWNTRSPAFAARPNTSSMSSRVSSGSGRHAIAAWPS